MHIKNIKKLLAIMIAASIAMAPCAEAKKTGSKGLKQSFKVKTGDIVEITSTDVRPGNSYTQEEVDKKEQEEKDKITNGQAGDTDDTSNAWKSALGIFQGDKPKNINGGTAYLTREQMEDLLGKGGKLPGEENGKAVLSPKDKEYLDRVKAIKDFIEDAAKGIVDEANSKVEGDPRPLDERVKDAVDQNGNPYDIMDLPEETPDDIELPDGALGKIWDDYQVDANDAQTDNTNDHIKTNPGDIANIEATDVSDAEVGQDTFYWRNIEQKNRHLLGSETNRFIEYTGICSACYNRAKKSFTEYYEKYKKKKKNVPNIDKQIDLAAKEYARYSRSKLCHCGKFIRCDSLIDGGKEKEGFLYAGTGAYKSRFGTDIRVDVNKDGSCTIDSFYLQDGRGMFDKTGENNFTSINHAYKGGGSIASELSVYTQGYGLYDNFTGEMLYSADDVSGAGENRYINGCYYSEKTAGMTLAQAYAAVKDNGSGNMWNPKSASITPNLDALAGLDNAMNRTIGDLLQEAYGKKGERVYQVKRSNDYETKEEFMKEHSDSAGGQSDDGTNLGGTDGDDIDLNPEADIDGIDGTDGTDDKFEDTIIDISDDTDDGDGNGDDGIGDDDGDGIPDIGDVIDKIGGTGESESTDEDDFTNPFDDPNENNGQGTNDNGQGNGQGTGNGNGTTSTDGNTNEVFDAKYVLIKIFGGTAGMDGVRKNKYYQELLKHFKNEDDLLLFIEGLIEAGLITKDGTLSEWSKSLQKEAEEFERSASETYTVKYYYSTNGNGKVIRTENCPLILSFKYDLYKKNGTKVIEGREWGGGSTYWVAMGTGTYTVKRYALVWNSVIQTREVTESLRVTDTKGNELYNRSYTARYVDAYGLKEVSPYWTNKGVKDITIKVSPSDAANSIYATSRVH